MLRSFDYAAARRSSGAAPTATPTGAEQRAYRAAEWAERNRDAFLDGVRRRASSTADEQALLDAYVADKAVYEAVYEARNRPDLGADPAGRHRAACGLRAREELPPWLYFR